MGTCSTGLSRWYLFALGIDTKDRVRAASGSVKVPWFSPLDLSLPYWVDYREPLQRLSQTVVPGGHLPGPDQLQQLLPGETANRQGRPIRFRPSAAIPGVGYEEHIFQTGEVSTREDSWHDLFNALVWSRWPRLKAAMNAAHSQEFQRHHSQRGPMRDALTLFDECGVVVVSSDAAVLDALSSRDWNQVFRQLANRWQNEIRIFVCGHALLEKFLQPYKAVTAHAVLLQLDSAWCRLPREQLLKELDTRLAQELLASRLLLSPPTLSPLPLMGIPGWWRAGPQDENFYADLQVFRPPASSLQPAPVHHFRDYRANP